MHSDEVIRIINASENNLNSVSLDIPKNKLVVVTGVSGSGKSSLIFDILYREAEFRYFGSFSSYALQFLGKMKRPEVERIEGLSPAVAVDQGSAVNNPRSTVGTLSGIYDLLRLLFARTGILDPEAENRNPVYDSRLTAHGSRITRSLFSFNSPEGACPQCKGLGVEDRLDPGLLIGYPERSIRQRAMTITTPNGYIMYSQVTLDVLDQVCRAEGFNIDIPWKDLRPEDQHVIFYGSDNIEIPFGKHPLESRMKWSGITAKPREMGVYKGIIPVMEEILKRDRNKNILRFVRTSHCSACGGKRLNPHALSVKLGNWDIAALSALPVNELTEALNAISIPLPHKEAASEIIQGISAIVSGMKKLGLGHLSSDRESGSLSAGESRRLRLSTQMVSGLSGMIYVFDEPSIGLHDSETLALIDVLKNLRDQGNTVIVVEHDEEFIRHADHIIDIGPGPGISGGNVLVNCAVNELKGLAADVVRSSKTLSYYCGRESVIIPAMPRKGKAELKIQGASHHNLKNIDVAFLTEALNVVTGVSGAGKASLVHQTLGSFLRKRLSGGNEEVGNHGSITGWEDIKRLIEADQSPIGRTPRSNPATYTGLFDQIRDLFASLPQALARGYGKSRFSFNTAGGRCEDCQGAGYRQTGMHFMGNVEVICETCNGRRFDNETLEIRWNGKNVFDVLEMPVSEAQLFFKGEKKILRYLEVLDELGLGYLTLGQRSSTLSGGEAQRVKLAAELVKNQEALKQRNIIRHSSPVTPHSNLYILDEPTTGLHNDDVKKLLLFLNRLAIQGHTIICIEHNPAFLKSADRVIELGPGSGQEGGNIVFSGTPGEYFPEEDRNTPRHQSLLTSHQSPVTAQDSLSLKNVTTHNLKGIDVRIPHDKLTVITGLSGSGKSSLAFDTIYAEARNRFLGNYSAYARTQIGMKDKPDFEELHGLRPAFAVDQAGLHPNPRSTVGTFTGIYDLYRLLYSRAGEGAGERPLSNHFSFNSVHGACPVCDGLGAQTLPDPVKLISEPGLSILNGAMDGSKTGKFYGDPYGQYTATLKAVGEKHGIDFTRPWNEVSSEGKNLAMNGCGEEIYDVSWEFLRNKRSGTHRFKGKWQGFLSLVSAEYKRKHADHRGAGMLEVMSVMQCSLCKGKRLKLESLSWYIGKKNIAELSEQSVSQSLEFFAAVNLSETREVSGTLLAEIRRRLVILETLGLLYLSLSRNSGSLSRGEARRLQLAAQTGSGLSGMIYVLDEPTAGLHSRETARLMLHVRELIKLRNTVIVVEHDRDVILGADHVIDMGPGAGALGGEIVAEGFPAEIMNSEKSVTGKYLKAGSREPGSVVRYPGTMIRKMLPGLKIINAFVHNLKNFDLEIPSGGIVCITGVSGSGKSSLVFDLIHASWKGGIASGCSEIRGFENFSRLVAVEQREEFSSPVAVVATYSGAFDFIRILFASSEEAMLRGFSKNDFSFLNRQSQCPHCEGIGKTRISMDFMPDVYQECEVCLGKRYSPGILEIGYQGINISAVLDLSVSEASAFFEGQKKLHSIFNQMEKAGLGYLKLGQPLNTLSGGEAQRLNLCRELLSQHSSGRTDQGYRMENAEGGTTDRSSHTTHPISLFLFDEPSTGLHFRDIENLLTLFNGLADQGNTLIVIEHDQQIIEAADFIIELGPEGGDNGGYLIKSVTSDQSPVTSH